MLGSAESVGSAAKLFAIVDKKYKIYFKKTSTVLNPRPDFQTISPYVPPAGNRVNRFEHPLLTTLKKLDPVQEAEKQVLEQFAPAWVLIDAAMEIVQFRGATSPFIKPANGLPSWSLMKMIHPSLSTDTRVLIHSAFKEGRAIRKNGISILQSGSTRTVDIEVSPVLSPESEPHCLILFTEHPPSDNLRITSTERLGKGQGTPGGKKLDDLRKENTLLNEELALTQKSLQAIIEDQNTTNEELQSANEEVMSANEELQSTNEELETAKEELQSTNEELTTLNDELSSRNSELDQLSNDLLNLLGNAHVSIVMVGLDLRIRRFTPMAEKLLKLIPADVGRSLSQINMGFKIEKLEEKIEKVMRQLTPLELETEDRTGHWYSIRIRPYKTSDNKIDGAVLVFVNIDERKSRERAAKTADTYSEGIIQTVRDPLIVLDQSLRVEKVNQAFYDLFKANPKETLGHLFYDLGNRQWDIPELRTLLEEILPTQLEIRDFKVSHRFKGIGAKTMLVHGRTIELEGQKKHLILITLRDVTGPKKRT